jgi:uncharacterized membrane protein YphA (DoxX/SURF4 family)
MKIIVNTARVLVGALFIFSGLVKAIDPLGLAYKMQEFFEVWARDGYLPSLMNWFYAHALLFSVIMITLEVVLGIALLLGSFKKLVSWLLLLLMLFFTFLTSYVLFSGKIRACGCFGDCIPLTPEQTFTKDIVLLILVLLILFGQQYIRPLFAKRISLAMILLSLLAVIALQWYVLKHLPLKDCLPYKIGNNILELRKMPKDAVADKYDYAFVYEKGGVKKEFRVDSLPDETQWTFVERKQVLVEKGKNNVPLINDFNLKQTNTILVYQKDTLTSTFEPSALPDSSWTFVENKEEVTDVTNEVLSYKGTYYMLFINDPANIPAGWEKDLEVSLALGKKGARMIIVTANYKDVYKRYTGYLALKGKKPNDQQQNLDKAIGWAENISHPVVLTSDVTAIKTAARNNVTLFLMDGPVVKNKWGGNDIEKALK